MAHAVQAHTGMAAPGPGAADWQAIPLDIFKAILAAACTAHASASDPNAATPPHIDEAAVAELLSSARLVCRAWRETASRCVTSLSLPGQPPALWALTRPPSASTPSNIQHHHPAPGAYSWPDWAQLHLLFPELSVLDLGPEVHVTDDHLELVARCSRLTRLGISSARRVTSEGPCGGRAEHACAYIIYMGAGPPAFRAHLQTGRQ